MAIRCLLLAFMVFLQLVFLLLWDVRDVPVPVDALLL